MTAFAKYHVALATLLKAMSVNTVRNTPDISERSTITQARSEMVDGKKRQRSTRQTRE